MDKRYKLVAPVAHGEQYWLIADCDFPGDPNFAVVQVYDGVPDVETKLQRWVDELNGEVSE